MHYRDLFVTHKAFWALESRAKHYDIYMKEVKDWTKWPESVDLFEIEKLLRFIPKWDMHFRMKNSMKVFSVYQEILPVLIKVKGLKLESVNLDTALREDIGNIFDKLAPSSEEAYESTDCSKILHTILPHLIVMWDMRIRAGILGNEQKKFGVIYASEFLPLMQTELREALAVCIDDRKLNFENACAFIRGSCGYETLPKLVDEHNYVIYTKHDEFSQYLNYLRKKHAIEPEDYERLNQKL